MQRNDSLKKNTFFLVVGTFLGKGLLFISLPFFSRWLTVEEYGQFDLIYTYISLLIPLVTLSTHEAVFRLAVDELDMDKKKNIIASGLLIDLVGFTIMAIVLFQSKMKVTILFCFLLYLFSEMFSVYLRGFLRAISRLDIYSVAMVITTVLITVLVTVFVYFMKMGLIGMLLGYGIGTLAGDLLLGIYSKWPRMLKWKGIDFLVIKSMIRYALPLMPNDVSWWVMNASDRQIINWFFGGTANGIYAIAHKIPAMCSIIFNMFCISWQQETIKVINLQNRNEYFNQIFENLICIVLTICAGLLSGCFIIYYFIFDIKYFEAISYTPILITAAAFMALSQFMGGIQVALKRTRESGGATVAGAFLNILLHLVLIKFVGLYAASISTLFANAGVFLIRMCQIRKVVSFKISKRIAGAVGGYLYFFFLSYIHHSMLINTLNVCLAVIFFFLWNRKVIVKLIEKKSC